MAQPSLTIVRRIKAPPDRVFDAFTRPEIMAQWWGPDSGPVLKVEVDPRVGGAMRIAFQTRDGATHEMTGVYQAVEPGKRLVWETVWVNFPERPSTVTVDFVAIPEGTELTIHHARFHDDDTRDLHAEGWAGTLEKLQTLLESALEIRA